MRKAMAFGAEKGLLDPDFFARHGLKLENHRKGRAARGVSDGSPILVVAGAMDGVEEEGFNKLLASDRRLPVIFIQSGASSPGVKGVRDRAKYALPQGFLARDLQRALRGCSEILQLQERLDALQGDLKAKTVELAHVLEIGKALASSFDLPKVLSKIMERVRSMVGSETWAVLLMDERDGELVLESAGCKGGRKLKTYRLKVGQGVAGRCAADRQPKLVNDLSAEGGFDRTFDKATGYTARSAMALPIMNRDKLLGVLELVNKKGGFTGEDLRLVQRLMDQIAIAIERAAMYRKMADLVITDDLTKLFNLRYLDRTLDVEIERSLRYNLAVSLIFMDIDFFKKVNDRHGHLTGSKLLVEVSQLMLKCLRKVDIVARYGGDEFIVVLPQTDVAAAKIIAERLRRNIEKTTFLRSEGLGLRITASFGIACYPAHASNKQEMIRLADEAMYRVKYQSRNSVYVVSE